MIYCTNCEKNEKEVYEMFTTTGFAGVNPLKPSDFKIIPPFTCGDCLNQLEKYVNDTIWGGSKHEEYSTREEWFKEEVVKAVEKAKLTNENILVFGTYTQLTYNFKVLKIKDIEGVNNFMSKWEQVKSDDVNSIFNV